MLCTVMSAWGADKALTYVQPTEALTTSTSLDDVTWNWKNGTPVNGYSVSGTTSKTYIFAANVLAYTSLNWVVQENVKGNNSTDAFEKTGIFKGSSYYFSEAKNNVSKLTLTRTLAVKVKGCTEASIYGAANISVKAYDATNNAEAAYNTLTCTEGGTTDINTSIATVSNLDKNKTYVIVFSGTTKNNANAYEVAFTFSNDGEDSKTITSQTFDGLKENNSVLSSDKYTVSDNTITLTDEYASAPTDMSVVTKKTYSDGTTETEDIQLEFTLENNEFVAKATIGETEYKVVAKKSSSTTVEQRTISETTTWNFSKTGISDKEIKYEDEAANVVNLYANIGATTSADFAADAITFQGTYPIRNSKMAQKGTLSFKTSKAGKIKVEFSDTGISGNVLNRYLVVNGNTTSYYVTRDGKTNGQKTTDYIYVPAGDVTIKGTKDICVYNISWEPTTNVDVTITSAGYASYAMCLPLDFSGVEGLTAYYATELNGSKVVLKKATSAAAGQGVILKGAEGTYTVPVAESGDALDGNLFKGLLGQTEVAASTDDTHHYVLATGNEGVGFYNLASSTTVPANKAYLETSEALTSSNYAKVTFLFPEDNVTGINSIKSEEGNGAVYNLAGQKIANPTKGLYIKNGKKYIVK